jgi:hypothetical protein
MDTATKIYLDEVNQRLDEYRKDEWHCMMPLSEEGGTVADNLVEFAIPKPEEGYPENADYVLLINEERTGFSEADVIGTTVIQSVDYIYHILKIGDGHELMASITRFDKNPND